MGPDVIDYDRKTPFPFMASGKAPSSPRSAYELISLELAFFLQQHLDQTRNVPSNRQLQLQACRVILASEALVSRDKDEDDGGGGGKGVSWLRDLITFDSEVAREARFGPIRSQAESRLATLQINGKKTLFEACPLEEQLQDFVQCSWAALAVVPMDNDLQGEACRIISRAEGELETKPPDFVANWLTKLVTSSSEWLGRFKQRTHLLPLTLTTQPAHSHLSSCETRLSEHDLVPYSCHDEQLGAAAFELPSTTTCPDRDIDALGPDEYNSNANLLPLWLKFGNFILNDANYHRWLRVELKRWAAATMSLDNPDHHIPSDEEIQHQARRLLYDE